MFFFFSSRRRHTRFDCDWSSDVCSSDLGDDLVFRFATGTRTGRPIQERPAHEFDHHRLQQCLFLWERALVFLSLLSPLLCRMPRSEEHTSELQSQSNLVCRLLLEKKKKKTYRM